jgi:hypothetical protein
VHIMEQQHIKQFLKGVNIFHKNIRQDVFSALYGVHFMTAAILYTLIVEQVPELKVVHMLWFLHWIRHYPTIQDAAVRWQCDTKTFRKYTWIVLAALFLSLDSVCAFNRTIANIELDSTG